MIYKPKEKKNVQVITVFLSQDLDRFVFITAVKYYINSSVFFTLRC